MHWLFDPEIAKPLGLLIFFVTFCLIVWWAYGSKKRSEHLEQQKEIPFLDDEEEVKDEIHG